MKLDLLLRNADIITMDDRRPHATSLGIWQGRIVGLDSGLDGLDAAEVLDLGGATVTPGFIDAHCHTTWFGLGMGEVDVSGALGLDQVYALLEADMAGGKSGDGRSADLASADGTGPDQQAGWLMATGFSQTQHGGEFPDIAVLDRITGDRPLFIRHNSGHMAVVNTAALRLAGAESASYPDPDGGVIVRDAAGRPTGLVQETAQQLIQQLILPYSTEAIEAALDRATRYYAAEGITSFTEAGIGGGWIGHSPVELAAYQRAAATGKLHARAQLMPVLDVLHPLAGGPAWTATAGLDLGMASGFGSDYLSLGPAKVFLDGSLLGETAAVSADYCSHGHTDNTGNTGYFQADPEVLREKIEAAYAAGWSVAAHAIGDRAVDLAIDIIAACAERYGPRALPNRIEHASVTRPDQVQRLADAGIAVTPQASFFADGGDGMTASLGPERIGWAYRAASFLSAGVTLAGSSDRPVADGNVLRGMQAFVDRRTSSGRVFGNPDERLSPRQALAAYTTGAAAATGTAQAKGTLTPGKLADFTVLSGSPLTAPDIAGLQVLATAVGGAFTHGESSFRSTVHTGQTAGNPSSGATFISTATHSSQESTVTTTTTLSARDTAFVRDFYTMSEFGATANGGVDRQAASNPDGQQRQWLKGLLEAKGFTVKFDRAGNEWGLFEAVPGAPYVVVGSHMDSQPTAGRYDGAYGVLAAAHAAFRLVEKWGASGPDGQPRFNIAVVNWFNEEGSRFKPSMMGSSVYTGKLELETALDTTDASGATVREALDAIGCRGDYEGPEAAYCAEIHIEQGRSMEREGVTIGLVHSNWAANKYEFVVHGEQAHTGSTVIADRKDALLGASMLVVAARELADRFPGVLHTSVGQLNVYPNSPVVVPSRVSLLLDLRSADESVLAEADALLHQRIREIERLANITVERNHSHSWPVTPYQPEGVELAAKVAADLGLASKEVMTLAGHDSTNMKDLVPTVMLFVPSVDGISHNEHEYTKDEDIVAGLTMLTEVVNRLCNGVLED